MVQDVPRHLRMPLGHILPEELIVLFRRPFQLYHAVHRSRILYDMVGRIRGAIPCSPDLLAGPPSSQEQRDGAHNRPETPRRPPPLATPRSPRIIGTRIASIAFRDSDRGRSHGSRPRMIYCALVRLRVEHRARCHSTLLRHLCLFIWPFVRRNIKRLLRINL